MPSKFDPQRVLIDWKDSTGFTIADATCGVCVTGATGSGKTSGPGQLLAQAYLRAGFGGLVLCAKADERAQWEAWAKAAGRGADLVIVNADGQARFNFLDWEASRADHGAGFAINVVALLDEIAGAIDGGSGSGDGGENAFFRSAHRNLLTNLVELPILAGIPVSLPLMRAIANSAPLSLSQRDDPEWQKTSACWRILREAEAATKDDADARWDFEECRSYWEHDFPALSDRTRSIITLMFGVLVRPFITRPLRRLFSEDTTVVPEDTFIHGKIVIVDLSVAEYRLAGRVAALAWKWCFQVAVMRRRAVTADDRRAFLWCDEAQAFTTPHDTEFAAVCRSSGGCIVYLTQQREGIRRVLRSDDATENLLANLQTKFFCQNTGATNHWAANLIGERHVKITSTSIGRSGQPGSDIGQAEAQGQAGIQRSEQKRHFLESSAFQRLRRGAPANNFEVEAVVYCGGKLFSQGTGEPLPYKLLTFRQR